MFYLVDLMNKKVSFSRFKNFSIGPKIEHVIYLKLSEKNYMIQFYVQFQDIIQNHYFFKHLLI